MNTSARRPRSPLALRREALIRECALQRLMLATEVGNLLAPLAPGNLRTTLGSRLKLPLVIAGVTLGLFVTRPRRALRTLAAGASLSKSLGRALPLMRSIAGRIGK